VSVGKAETEAIFSAELEVRIQLPPAASQTNSHPNRRVPSDLEVVRYWDLAATERTKLNDRTRRSAPSSAATKTVANPGAGRQERGAEYSSR
jgi:hypothetical protein